MAQAGADTADHLAGRHPTFAARGERIVAALFERDAGGFDEHTLDLRAGVRLLGCHDGSADEHTIHRHGRLAVSTGPFAGNVIRGALGRADAAAGDQHEVLAAAHVSVCVEQQVVQRLPGMVSAGGTAFDFGDDGDRGDRLRDAHHLADLVDRTRLECHVRQTVGAQGCDELLGFVEFRDARGHDHAVDRGAGGTLLRYQSLRAELEVPQVAVHEHRVEFDRTAFLKLILKLGQMLVKHLGGHLTATGEFGPVSGVRRGCDNLRVHGGRGHAGQQNRRLAGQLAEFRGDAVAGWRVDDTRTIRIPVLQTFRLAGQCRQRRPIGGAGRLDHAGTTALGERGDQFAGGRARPHIDDPQCGRVGGRKQFAYTGSPIHMIDQHLFGKLTGTQPIEAARLRPRDRLVDGLSHKRGMERQRHVKVFERRIEHRTTAYLLLAQTRLLAMLLAGGEREQRQILRVSGQDLMVGGVLHGDGDRPAGGRDTRNQRFSLFAVRPLDRQHRGGAFQFGMQAEQTGLARAGDTDEAGDGENLINRLLGGFERTGMLQFTRHMHADNTLRVAEQRHRLRSGIVSQMHGVHNGCKLGKRNAFDAHRRVGGGTERSTGRFESEHVDWFSGHGEQIGGHGGEQTVCGKDLGAQVRGESRVVHRVGERRRPRCGLPAEHHGMRFVDKSGQEWFRTGHCYSFTGFRSIRVLLIDGLTVGSAYIG